MTAENKEQPGQTRIFNNGTILTMDAEDSTAEAVTVRNGRIEAVGTNQEVNQRITDECVVVDLAGKTVVPGFIEAHGHFPWSGFDAIGVNLNSSPIGSMTRISDVVEALKKKAAETEKRKWVYWKRPPISWFSSWQPILPRRKI